MLNKFNREILHNNLNILRKSVNMQKGEFCEYIGIANAFRNDYESIGAKLLKGIQDRFPGITEDWLLTTRPVNYKFNITAENNSIAEPNTEYSSTPKPHPEPSYPDHLVHKTRTVLTSDTVFRRALDSNIEAFHEAVSMKEQLAETKAALAQCIDQIALLKNEIEHLKGDREKKAV